MKDKLTYKYLLTTLTVSAYLFPASNVALAQGTGINYTVKSYIGPNSIEELLVAILNIFIVIATPIIILFIIYAGFLYVTARGNAEQVSQATRALTYAVIGGVIILGALAISEILKNLVEGFKA